MTDWPGSLPVTLIASGLNVQRVPTVVVQQPDQGPPMARRRFSLKIETATGSVILTPTQWATLQTFFDTTLAGGSLRFNFTHPVDGTSVVAQFQASDAACCALTGSDGAKLTVGIKLWLFTS